VVGAQDLPSEPEDRGRTETAGYGTVRGKSQDTPDPDERGRVYEAMRAHVSAETRDEAEPGRRLDWTDKPSYWDKLPRFHDMWTDHLKRWPEDRRPAVDRSDDPPRSYRSDGGFYLSPERHAEAIAAVGRVREAEPTISADMQRVERDNRHGGWLEGFGNRLKDDDRLKEKVAEGLSTIGPDAKSEELLQQVPDAIRFTFCFPVETYSGGYFDICERLEKFGHEMYQAKNSWSAEEYKGINTRWVTEEGQRFEVQVHTAESFHVKQYVTHEAYERIRNPLTSDEERRELEAFQREVSSRIEVPDGVTDIPDFKKEGF
jgi:hypothetical protein